MSRKDRNGIDYILSCLKFIDNELARYTITNTFLAEHELVSKKLPEAIATAMLYSYLEVLVGWYQKEITDEEFKTVFGFDPQTINLI